MSRYLSVSVLSGQRKECDSNTEAAPANSLNREGDQTAANIDYRIG